MMVVFVFFFFSSRRRHTRFSRDWSSDVCSSDLWEWEEDVTSFADVRIEYQLRKDGVEQGWKTIFDNRSEERRVGKECRSRWWRYEWLKIVEVYVGMMLEVSEDYCST